METVRVVSMNKDFHVECYRCLVSLKLISKTQEDTLFGFECW